jgi:Beta-galactosidase
MKYPGSISLSNGVPSSQSHIVTVVSLIAAAVVNAIASFKPDPLNTRLTNNGAGYVTGCPLVTGKPYTDDVLQACSESRGGEFTLRKRVGDWCRLAQNALQSALTMAIITLSSPYVRRRALLVGLFLNLIGTLPAFCGTPRGVFCLLPCGAGAAKKAAVYSDPNVDGISVRQKWYDLEPKDGVFDFRFLDTVTSKAAAAGKKVLLRIGTSGGSADKRGSTPNWVFDAIKAEPLPASQKFFTWNDNGRQRTIPVFWDPVYLAKKKAMIRALGAHFAKHPAVKIVSASFANASSEDWAVPHTDTDVRNWLAAGYSSYKMLNAGMQIIDATMSAFPYQYVSLAVGGNGHTGRVNLDPDENYVARHAILAARASWPGRLIVQKNTLATFTPPAPGTDTLYQLVWDSAPATAAQMLWWCYGDKSYRVSGGVHIDPSKALKKSVDVGLGYGLRYIEIYRKDILNLREVTKYAHDALTAATPLAPQEVPAFPILER